MRHILVAVAIAAVCALSSSALTIHAQGGTDRYLVVFKSDTLPPNVTARIAARGGFVVRTIPEIGVAVAAGDERFASAIAQDTAVAAVGGERVFALPPVQVLALTDATSRKRTSTAGDTLSDSYQWDMRRIGAPAVWDRLPVSAITPRVAVLDVGVMDTHPDLAGQVDYSLSTSYCPATGGHSDGYPIYTSYIDFDAHPTWYPSDGCTNYKSAVYEWHGTHVASTVAAKFGGGRVVGVAPDANIGAYKVFDHYRYTDANGTVQDGVGAFDAPIFAAIVDATSRGYRVISMSLGSVALRNNYGDNASWLAWDRVAKWANRHGVVIVAAAGNDALNLNGVVFSSPSDLSTVVSVAATGTTAFMAGSPLTVAPGHDILASYSNYGSPIDIAAPGGDCSIYVYDTSGHPIACDGHAFIVGAGIDEHGVATYYLAAGTSMATPHVSAVAAQVLAIHPDWTPGAVRSWLKLTADPMPSRQFFGAGYLNADAAVR